jgi:hypothetical protein
LRHPHFLKDGDDMQVEQDKVNGKAITSLVSGILALIIPYVGTILCIVFARKALKEISDYKQSDRRVTITGLTTGIIGVSLYCMILLFLIIIGAYHH